MYKAGLRNFFCRWSWAKTGSVAIPTLVAAVVVGSLLSRSSLAQAQTANKTPAPEAKQNTKTPPPAAANAIPGAGTKVDAAKLSKIIDAEINRQLAADKIQASPKSSDTEFLRRVYLDIVGVIPPAEKVKEFLDSKDPDKRAKVIDELLADPRFGNHLGEMWSGLLMPRMIENRRIDHAPMQKWLSEKFNSNHPLNKTVYELVTAIGEQDSNPAVTYYINNPTVDKMVDNVSRMFMGVQLTCAQCHNHPFTDYKQTEFWGMAAFFMKVQLTTQANAAKKAQPVGVVENTAAPINKAKKGKGALPEGAKIVPAKFLQGEQPKMKTDEPYRPVLGNWITNGSNPFFARAMANRFWHQLFARGLVNPVDNMHDDNGATHPELLAALAEQFTRNDFDTKYLFRAICNSETYQRTSNPFGNNADDKDSYSHRLVRVLSPEQLYDSITEATGAKLNAKANPVAKQKGPALTGRDAFTNFFRIDEGADPLEYQVGIPQALRLMNSPQFSSNSPAVTQAMKEGKTPAEIIEKLFLRTVSRAPTAQEVERFSAHLTKAGDARTGYGDILWALVNSSEFTFNH